MAGKYAVVQINIKYEDSENLRLKQNIEDSATMHKNSSILANFYAERCNADYHMITERHIIGKSRAASFEKMQLFTNDKWLEYDKILYLDTDTFVWTWIPDNVFEITPFDSFCVVDHINKEKLLSETKGEKYKKYVFNAGVFIINKYTILKMREFLDVAARPYSKYRGDQQLLKGLCFGRKHNIEVNMFKLDWRYNAKPEKNDKPREISKKHYITHLWGGKKRNNKSFRDKWDKYSSEVIASMT